MPKLGSKGSLWVKFKDGICIKLRVERDRNFCNITESGWFLK